jgi:hypothetical protein
LLRKANDGGGLKALRYGGGAQDDRWRKWCWLGVWLLRWRTVVEV